MSRSVVDTASLGALGVTLALALSVGCERKPAPETRAAAARREQAREQDEKPRSLLSPEAEELRVELAREETYAQCVERIGDALPAALAESLVDVGYATAVDDACASLDALRARSQSRCDELSVDAARRQCRSRVAVLTGEPDACPPDAIAPGRDALCLAWSARAEALCAGAAREDRARCRAVLRGETAACAEAEAADALRCVAEVRRYAGLLAPSAGFVAIAAIDVRALRDGAMHVETRPLSAVTDAVAQDASMPATLDVPLDRGIVLHRCGDLLRVVVREPTRLPLETTARLRRASNAAVVLDVPTGATLPLTRELDVLHAWAALVRPDAPPLEVDHASIGRMELTRFEPRRGGLVELSANVSWRALDGRAYETTLQARTFVRDVIDGDDSCSVAPARAR